MRKIRVLIVDDAVVVRKLIGDTLAQDPDLEVAGTAATGRIALAKLTQVNPDILTLDVEMPDLDGLETLTALRKTHPKLPVIMFSTLTERGGLATLEALARGATDYVTKPANVGSIAQGIQRIRDELIPKIKQLCGRAVGAARRTTDTPAPAAPVFRPPADASRVDVVAIGSSTGGPNALAEVLPRLTKPVPVPVVIVQHMPPIFTRLLAERLAASSGMTVAEAVDGADLKPGHVWIAPGDFHMTVTMFGGKPRIRLNQGPPENSCRPAVDVLFRSVAEVFGARTLAVVLTGMGQDGLRGCEMIRDAGGRVLTQDEATSVVWGMPGYVTQAGLSNKVLPLNLIATEIDAQTKLSRLPTGPAFARVGRSP